MIFIYCIIWFILESSRKNKFVHDAYESPVKALAAWSIVVLWERAEVGLEISAANLQSRAKPEVSNSEVAFRHFRKIIQTLFWYFGVISNLSKWMPLKIGGYYNYETYPPVIKHGNVNSQCFS